MANPQNLKPYKKGTSGNLAGRPLKCPDIDAIIAKVLSEKCSNNLTRAENIFRKMAIKAETDCRAAEMILDRGYGKLKTSTGVEIDFMRLSEPQLDQVIKKLISHD